MTEQDDMDNWKCATEGGIGTIAQRYPYNYQQSMNAETRDGVIPGAVSKQISEHMARGFYRQWNAYMSGASWPELLVTEPVVVQREAA
jgi:hypothetical protein